MGIQNTKLIDHFSHPQHSLCLSPVPDLPYPCAICNRELRAEQESDVYRCAPCEYYIHTRCAEHTEDLDHLLHPLHPLRLVKRPFAASCYYCEKLFGRNEYAYACEQCSDFHMHIACAIIPLPKLSFKVGEGQDHDGVAQYVCHQHPMASVEHPDGSKEGAKCFACQSLWSGPAYSCTNTKCENFLHKSCAELPKEIPHKLPPSYTPSVECALLDMSTVMCQSHDHVLFLVEKALGEINCDSCQKSYKNWVNIVPNEITLTQSYLFRCMDCNFNLHFLCGPLPLELKYEYHVHPLTLSDHSVMEDYSKEYFCDACEEERDPHFRLYYCKDCKYIAHIHCMISKITEVIKGNSDEVELRALGENPWSTEVGSKKGIMRGVKEVGSRKLILKVIMHSLTEEEKQQLASPFTIVGTAFFRRKQFRLYLCCSEIFNVRFDHVGPAEDTDKLQRLFRFQSSDFSSFIDDIRYYEPPGGLKLDDDKFLRQEVEDIDGYMVPRTLAPILRALLHKYPDLGGCNSSLTPAMKSVTSTLLCIVIERMCKTLVDDITEGDLKCWYFYLLGIRAITDFKIVESISDSLGELVRAFFGLEVIRFGKEGIKRLDYRISELQQRMSELQQRMSELEAELKGCKGLRGKYIEYDKSAASDFIRKTFSIAEELKWKNAGEAVLSKIL